MRFALIAIIAATLAACTATVKDPNLFYAPEDCNDLSKHSHPDYLVACGERR